MDLQELRKNLDQIRGLVGECLDHLDNDSAQKRKAVKGNAYSPQVDIPRLDFTIPNRAFVKKYAREMSGPQKFVLLLAYLSKGDRSKSIQLSEINKNWSRMKAKSLLGMRFNRFFTAQAKEKDWVESKKPGEYNLRPAWKESFS